MGSTEAVGTGPTVGDLMIAGVVSVDPSDTIGRARELMLGLGFHSLPVVDSQGEVVGFVTSSDLVEEWPFGEAVETIMSRRVIAIDVSDSAERAAGLMLDEGIHHLLVNRRGRPVGVLSSFDLLAVVAGRDRVRPR